jgi:hypothetical protein
MTQLLRRLELMGRRDPIGFLGRRKAAVSPISLDSFYPFSTFSKGLLIGA